MYDKLLYILLRQLQDVKEIFFIFLWTTLYKKIGWARRVAVANCWYLFKKKYYR